MVILLPIFGIFIYWYEYGGISLMGLKLSKYRISELITITKTVVVKK